MLPVELRPALSLEIQSSILDWIVEVQTRWQAAPELTIDPEKLSHLAIICDGNRRAAIRRGIQPSFLAHLPGIETVLGIDRIARREWRIPTCTYWLWSTENWERGPDQAEFMLALARKYLTSENLLQELVSEQVRIVHIGKKVGLPEDLATSLSRWEKTTKAFTNHTVNLAINYGGQDELARAFKQMLCAFKTGKLDPNDLPDNPQIITMFLDTRGQNFPDLLVRTGMTRRELPRTSGFMPFQTAYTRMKFLPDLFPELTPSALIRVINQFQKYKPRFGR